MTDVFLAHCEMPDDLQRRARNALRREIRTSNSVMKDDTEADAIVEQIWNALVGLDRIKPGRNAVTARLLSNGEPMAKTKTAKAAAKSTMLAPPITTLVKLGSIAVHADEMLSADGHDFDKVALQHLLHDPDVVEWIAQMTAAAMVPLKRSAR